MNIDFVSIPKEDYEEIKNRLLRLEKLFEAFWNKQNPKGHFVSLAEIDWYFPNS
jgi:hypothetical protein